MWVPVSQLTFQISIMFQSPLHLNQLGSKAASESTFKQSNTCGVSNTQTLRLLFLLYMEMILRELIQFGWRAAIIPQWPITAGTHSNGDLPSIGLYYIFI